MKTGKQNKKKPVGEALKVYGGSSTIPNVICFQSVFSSEFTGAWLCFHSDGSSHSSTSSSNVFTAVGSPTTQTIMTLPSGPNGSLVTQQVVSSGNRYETAAMSSPSGDFSVGVVAKAGVSAGQQEYISRWGTPPAFAMEQNTDNTIRFYTADAVSNTYAPTVTSLPGSTNSVVFTFKDNGGATNNIVTHISMGL